MISTRKDLLSEDIATELTNYKTMLRLLMVRLQGSLRDELGKNINDIFESFDSSPMASASIAQVHPAKLKTGEDVIVKVVRPDIRSKIIQDISLMKKIANYLENLSDDFKRMHLIDIVDDYEMVIYDELNLIKEAANAKQIRKNFLNSTNIYIPTVYCSYLTNKVMIMERIYGIPINDKKSLEMENISLRRLQKNLLNFSLSKYLSIISFTQICTLEIYLFKNIRILSDSFLLILALWVR